VYNKNIKPSSGGKMQEKSGKNFTQTIAEAFFVGVRSENICAALGGAHDAEMDQTTSDPYQDVLQTLARSRMALITTHVRPEGDDDRQLASNIPAASGLGAKVTDAVRLDVANLGSPDAPAGESGAGDVRRRDCGFDAAEFASPWAGVARRLRPF
jgi:hypothetical protein